MRLLLLGANGQVGWELNRSLMPLGEVVALDRQQCDLSHPERLPALVRGISPAVIINAAGYTAVDQAEGEEHLAMTVNCTAVGVLAEQARACGALLVQYSTDYVFDGTKEGPYLEEDAPNPINDYGRSKLAGEIAIRQAGARYLIFRTSWIYAARGRNFVRTLLQLAGEKDDLPVVVDQIGTPNWARNIADATVHAVRQAITEDVGASFVSGLFHLTASGTTTWYGFAEAILEYATRNGLVAAQRLPRLRPIPTEDYPTLAARPKNSRLEGYGLKEHFGIVLPDWKQGLAMCLEETTSCRR